MRLDPRTLSFNVTRLPLACFGKMTSDMPVMTAGYSSPVSTVKTSVNRNPSPISLIMMNSFSPRLGQTQSDDQLIDRPNPRERDNNSTKAIYQKIPAQHLTGADRLVLHAA